MGPGLIETLIAFCLNFGVGHQQHHFLFVPELQITICQLPPFVNARAKEIAIVHLSKKRNCCFTLYTFLRQKDTYLGYLQWSVKVRESSQQNAKCQFHFFGTDTQIQNLRHVQRTHKMLLRQDLIFCGFPQGFFSLRDFYLKNLTPTNLTKLQLI